MGFQDRPCPHGKKRYIQNKVRTLDTYGSVSGILATYNAYHGKTLGALSATGKKKNPNAIFGAPVEGFEYIPFGNLASLEEKLKSKAGGTTESQFAAFIVEPIQVIPPPYPSPFVFVSFLETNLGGRWDHCVTRGVFEGCAGYMYEIWRVGYI